MRKALWSVRARPRLGRLVVKQLGINDVVMVVREGGGGGGKNGLTW